MKIGKILVTYYDNKLNYLENSKNICRKSAKICPVPFSVFLDLVIKTITFILSSDVRC